MKNNFKYSWIVIAIIATCFSSCQKYLDRNPLSSISQRDFYTDAAQVQQALVGVYNAIGARKAVGIVRMKVKFFKFPSVVHYCNFSIHSP